jgi:hypothetical protein
MPGTSSAKTRIKAENGALEFVMPGLVPGIHVFLDAAAFAEKRKPSWPGG